MGESDAAVSGLQVEPRAGFLEAEFLLLWKTLLFTFRPSTDCRPVHVIEGDLLY